MFKGEHTMSTKTTQAQLFARIAETMKDDDEVVAFCEKKLAQLEARKNAPRKPRVNTAAIEFAQSLYEMMVDEDADLTTKEWTAVWNEKHEDAVSTQKVSAALRRLADDGLVNRHDAGNSSTPSTFEAVLFLQ
jgi:glutaminase